MKTLNTFDNLLSNPEITKEYKRTLLLNIFKKICFKMNKSEDYKRYLKQLYLESFNQIITTQNIVKKEFSIELSNEEASELSKWFLANFKKTSTRKKIPDDVRKQLILKQNNKCIACGETLGDISKAHVDHIIPWVLVGDELENNYQVLCDKCNECKSASIDFMFRLMLNLI